MQDCLQREAGREAYIAGGYLAGIQGGILASQTLNPKTETCGILHFLPLLTLLHKSSIIIPSMKPEQSSD